MKFKIKVGNNFELKLDIYEKKHINSNVYKAFVLIMILFASAAIYGAKTGDYKIFSTMTQTLNNGIENIGAFVKAANNEDTS